MMKGKKGNFMVAYNIQSAVGYDTNNLCIKRHTKPYRPLPTTKVADKAINNMGKVSKHISADIIYLNQICLTCFVNKGMDGLIPTRKQSKEKIGKLNTNQFHKDHFYYISDLDLFMYPAGQLMYFYKEYTEENEDPNKQNKIKRLCIN